MTELELKIVNYAKSYYEGNPEISDAEFDDLVDELREINPNSEVLKSVGWGSGVENNSGEKVNHKYQLIGSLGKIKEFDKIPEYDPSVLSAKLDGLSAVAYYENGKLIKAVTRGNGTVGIDITDKFIKIVDSKSITIKEPIAIRGELVISNKDWELMKQNNTEFKNSRNAAAGIINRNEITDDLNYISFVAYNIIGLEIESDEQTIYSQNWIYSILEDNFNTVCPHCFLTLSSFNETLIKACFRDYSKLYPCDGIVIGDNTVIRNPSTSAMRYNQIAFKFPAEVKTTTVNNIYWNLTKTGKLVPTIIFDRIDLSGATVTKCAGFNAKFIKDNEIGTGAIISVMRSGEVIPDIQNVIKTGDLKLPTNCPVCGEVLEWSGVDLICTNPDCVAKEYRDFECWCENLSSVDGIGTTLKFKFFNELGIKNIEQLYSEDIIFNGTGSQRDLFRKVLNKLITEEINSVDALCALNIPRLGRTTSKKLSEHPDVIIKCLKESVEYGRIISDLSDIVGSATNDSIKNNVSKFLRLNLIINRIKFADKIDKSNMVKVAITGKLSIKRSEFEKLLEDNGFILSSVSKGTEYLITDDPFSGSSKNVKADQLGIKKITEQEFRDLFNL